MVVGGHQPSYKRFVDVWMKSSRRGNGARAVGSNSTLYEDFNRMDEWLIPFPRFSMQKSKPCILYAERCWMVSDWMRLLHVLASLSFRSQKNLLTHSHSRNNHAVLFNLACAMIIHITHMLPIENSGLAQHVSDMQKRELEKQLSVDGNCAGYVIAVSSASPGRTTEKPSGPFYKETTELLFADITTCGRNVGELIIRTYCGGCDGHSFFSTVLFPCLLLPVVFHVLSHHSAEIAGFELILCFLSGHSTYVRLGRII